MRKTSLSPRRGAFTLIELLAVLGMLALLATMLLPALARSQTGSKAYQCLNNNRQLCAAWRMYADDNRDLIVYASDNSPAASNHAWTMAHIDFNPNNRANWDTNFDITQRPLWPYAAKNASIYKCPSDPSTVTVSGVVRPRVRSMSMNFYLGGFAGTDGGLTAAAAYRIFTSTAQFSAYNGASSKIFVFVDERFDLINFGNFFVDMAGYNPPNPAVYQFSGDMPGMYHDRAASFSFADGHAEMKRWLDPRTTAPYYTVVGSSIPSPANPDVFWLQDHSTRAK